MKILGINKNANFDYAIQETMLAGIILNGDEVKSAKNGNLKLNGSYVLISEGKAKIINLFINKYLKANNPDKIEPSRTRELLLKQKEIEILFAKKQQGMQLIPTKAGLVRGFIKIEIGIGKPKQKWDKRQDIIKRDSERQFKKLN